MPVLEKWTPFREFDLIDQRMRRLFSGFGLVPTPPADIYENGDEYVVELEVPGYDQKELEVKVFDHTLTVKGERKQEKEKTETTMRLHERLETTFERRFDLPAEVDSEQLVAAYGRAFSRSICRRPARRSLARSRSRPRDPQRSAAAAQPPPQTSLSHPVLGSRGSAPASGSAGSR
jgi:HSP20 family molecular chaperone IbpA